MSRTVLITGAAGNLGGFLARRLVDSPHRLRLMVHRSPLDSGLSPRSGVEMVPADLGEPATLDACCEGTDCIVHFAGKLFAPGPRKFLPVTNTRYARNLVQAAADHGVARFVLISFPHVEGPTSLEHPATDRLDRTPVSVHARTRLEEERLLFDACRGCGMEPVVLRAGMVYARGVLMIDWARKLLGRRLLGVWRRPTRIHLVALHDFLEACVAAIDKPGLHGIYNLGDEQPTTLQAFLDRAARHWKLKLPWRAPAFLFYVAAWLVEAYARIARCAAPLTTDFIRIGRVSYAMDTTRTRRELLPALRFPTLDQGITEL